MKTLAEAVVIVLAVSFSQPGLAHRRRGRAVVPLVLALTFLVMYLLGIDLQRISLGALIISLGLLVDDAIIAVEMMALKMEQGWDRFRAATYAYTSTASPDAHRHADHRGRLPAGRASPSRARASTPSRFSQWSASRC